MHRLRALMPPPSLVLLVPRGGCGSTPWLQRRCTSRDHALRACLQAPLGVDAEEVVIQGDRTRVYNLYQLQDAMDK